MSDSPIVITHEPIQTRGVFTDKKRNKKSTGKCASVAATATAAALPACPPSPTSDSEESTASPTDTSDNHRRVSFSEFNDTRQIEARVEKEVKVRVPVPKVTRGEMALTNARRSSRLSC